MIVGLDHIEDVKRILTHPAVWDWISDDNTPEPGDYPFESIWAHCSVLMPNQHTVITLAPLNHWTVEFHTAIVPEGRGKQAIMAIRSMFEWVFTKTRNVKIITHVPETNLKAYAMARRLGLTLEGVNRGSWVKDGKIYDQALYGLMKGEWECH